MEHKPSERQLLMRGFIELLNDMSYNVIHIDSTFYIFTSFIEVDQDSGINEITLEGKDITSDIENATVTSGMSTLRKQEFVGKVDAMKSRRRVFSPGTHYVKYLH